MSPPRVIVVAKRSAYRRFVVDERDPRAKQLLRRRDPSVASWFEAHREHERTLVALEKVLDNYGAQVMWVQRAHAMFDASGAALVIAVGGDGTLLAASHSLDSTPILGVNSAPKHSVGFFCAARRESLSELVPRALDGELRSVTLSRMRVSVNGRLRSLRILNDALFAHSSPAATSRYILRIGDIEEEHRSSGFWIGPAAGSTAAMRSAGGRVLPLASRKLQIVVREPYAPFGRRYRLLKRLVDPGETVLVRSKMDESMVWLDGPHRQFPVRLGERVEFGLSEAPLRVLGLTSKRSKR